MYNQMIVKTDEESISLLCNSINAVQGGLRYEGEREKRIADLLLRAQATITVLYQENQALRGEKA